MNECLPCELECHDDCMWFDGGDCECVCHDGWRRFEGTLDSPPTEVAKRYARLWQQRDTRS